MAATRRLAAILAADVVGYSRLMGADEEGTHERLKAHLTPAQIIELACVVGFWKMYNTIHDSLRIPIEAHLLEQTEYIHA